MAWTRQLALPISASKLILTQNASPRVGALRPARHAIIVSFAAGLQRISRQKSQWHPRRNHNGFAPPLARPPLPPAQCRPIGAPSGGAPGHSGGRVSAIAGGIPSASAGSVSFPVVQFFPSFRLSRHSAFPRHSGESRNLRAAIFPSFRRKPESTPCDSSRHSGASRNLRPALSPSFRRKPESTPHDGLRFSPESRLHTQTTGKEPLPPRPSWPNPAKFSQIAPQSPLTNASSCPILAIVRCGEEKRSGFASAKRKVTATS